MKKNLKVGWLVDIGDEKLPSYMGIIMHHYNTPPLAIQTFHFFGVGGVKFIAFFGGDCCLLHWLEALM